MSRVAELKTAFFGTMWVAAMMRFAFDVAEAPEWHDCEWLLYAFVFSYGFLVSKEGAR